MNKKCAELLGKLGGGIFILGVFTEGCIRYTYPENNSTKTSSKQTWANFFAIACLVVGAFIGCAGRHCPNLKTEDGDENDKDKDSSARLYGTPQKAQPS